jgi:NAD(P)-dependent dehydrogenase (short-subunit alcohol dehydrogenase family)
MGKLDGKVAVITGSSRGLGLAIAETYAREGAAVVLAARTQQTVDQAVRELQAKGYRAAGTACDVGKLEQVEGLAQTAIQAFGQIDIWVNNAGVSGVYGPTAHLPVETFERVVRTNILGVYYGSVVALKAMVPRGTGKLINLLGRGDSGPVKFQNAYASSKTWVRSFTLALAKEYAESGVGIFAFNPGLVDTDMLRQVEALQGYEGKLKPLSTVIRLWANPPGVPADRALWLASSATDGKTGLKVSVLGLPQLISGLVRDLGRRLTGRMGPDATLDITSVPPVF